MISQGFLEERAKKAVNAHHLLPEFIYNIYNTQHTASPYQPEIYSSCPPIKFRNFKNIYKMLNTDKGYIIYLFHINESVVK